MLVRRPTATSSTRPPSCIGVATNNVAEYRGAAARARRGAKALGATEVEVVNDSELIAKQVNGQYKVKHPAMRPLYLEAMAALREFDALVDPLGPARRRTPTPTRWSTRRWTAPAEALSGKRPAGLEAHGACSTTMAGLGGGLWAGRSAARGSWRLSASFPINPCPKTQIFGLVRALTSRGGDQRASGDGAQVRGRAAARAERVDDAGSNCVPEQSRSSRSASSGVRAAL